MGRIRLALTSAVIAALLPPAAAAQERADLVVAVQTNPDTLEPMREFSNVGMRVAYNIAETLIDRDFHNDHALVPGLATSWERVDDRTIDFTLREDVTCHNGEPLTAEDVAFTFGEERFLNENAPGRPIGQILLGSLEAPEVLDTHRIRIRSSVPDPLLEVRMASYTSQIICRDAYVETGDWDAWGLGVVATGPYRIAEFLPGEAIRIERFDGYWGEPAPVDSVTFRVVPELSTRIAGLVAGEFDIITEVTPDQLAEIDAEEGFVTVGGPIRNIRLLVFDSQGNSAIEDPRIRQAMSLAIDRQLIVDTLFHGRTEVPRGMQFAGYGDMFLENWPMPAYDPDQARALLEEAGYDGAPVTLRTVGTYYTAEMDTSRAVVNMWREVGLNAQLAVVENWDQVYEDNEARNAQNTSSTGFLNDPAGHLWRIFSPRDRFQVRGFWGNDAFNALGPDLEVSFDRAERRELFRQMMEIFEQDPPGTVLFAAPMFYGMRGDIDWRPYDHEYMGLRADNLSVSSRPNQ